MCDMTRCISVFVSMMFALYPGGFALATESHEISPFCDPDQPTHCATDLAKGQPAPFAGQLLTTELAIDLGQKAEHGETRCQLRIDHEKALAGIELAKESKVREVEAEACQASQKRLQGLLEAAEGRPWFEHPAVVASVSVVATAGIMVALWYVSVKTVQAVK